MDSNRTFLNVSQSRPQLLNSKSEPLKVSTNLKKKRNSRNSFVNKEWNSGTFDNIFLYESNQSNVGNFDNVFKNLLS